MTASGKDDPADDKNAATAPVKGEKNEDGAERVDTKENVHEREERERQDETPSKSSVKVETGEGGDYGTVVDAVSIPSEKQQQHDDDGGRGRRDEDKSPLPPEPAEPESPLPKDEDVLVGTASALTAPEDEFLDPKVKEEQAYIESHTPRTPLEIALASQRQRSMEHIDRLTAEILKLKAFISKRKQTYKRKRKETGAPTRALSAYNIFVKERFKRLSRENEVALKSSDTDARLKRVPPASLVASTGNQWKELSAQEKQYYEEKAQADRKRYEEEMANYQAPESAHGRGARKRNKTGYNMFFSQHVLRLKQTESGVPSERGSVARLVGEAWKQLSAEEKQYYEREADANNQENPVDNGGGHGHQDRGGGGSASPGGKRGGGRPIKSEKDHHHNYHQGQAPQARDSHHQHGGGPPPATYAGDSKGAGTVAPPPTYDQQQQGYPAYDYGPPPGQGGVAAGGQQGAAAQGDPYAMYGGYYGQQYGYGPPQGAGGAPQGDPYAGYGAQYGYGQAYGYGPQDGNPSV